jgi:hypothetical protein
MLHFRKQPSQKSPVQISQILLSALFNSFGQETSYSCRHTPLTCRAGRTSTSLLHFRVEDKIGNNQNPAHEEPDSPRIL